MQKELSHAQSEYVHGCLLSNNSKHLEIFIAQNPGITMQFPFTFSYNSVFIVVTSALQYTNLCVLIEAYAEGQINLGHQDLCEINPILSHLMETHANPIPLLKRLLVASIKALLRAYRANEASDFINCICRSEGLELETKKHFVEITLDLLKEDSSVAHGFLLKACSIGFDDWNVCNMLARIILKRNDVNYTKPNSRKFCALQYAIMPPDTSLTETFWRTRKLHPIQLLGSMLRILTIRQMQYKPIACYLDLLVVAGCDSHLKTILAEYERKKDNNIVIMEWHPELHKKMHQIKTQRASLRRELNLYSRFSKYHASDLAMLVNLLTLRYFRLTNSVHRECPERRFFALTSQLPMEIQHIICLYAYNICSRTWLSTQQLHESFQFLFS